MIAFAIPLAEYMPWCKYEIELISYSLFVSPSMILVFEETVHFLGGGI